MVVQKSVPIQLPMATTAKVDLDRKIPVTVTSNGQIYVEQEAVSMDQFVRIMQAEKAKGDNVTIIVRADTKSEYGGFVTVLDTLKKIGITRISIATESH